MNKRSGNLHTEKKTVAIMIGMYCRGNNNASVGLCPDCAALLAYAQARLAACPFGENKKACGKCSVHCYKPDMREKIAKVMRYSGPRMLPAHPFLAIRHLLSR